MKKILSNYYILKNIFTILFIIFFLCIDAQENQFYNDSYQTLDNMLSNREAYSFKKAVFNIENAYYQGKLDTDELNQKIDFLTNFCKQLIENRKLTYSEKDETTVNKYAAIYTVMCQATPVIFGQDTLRYKPFI